MLAPVFSPDGTKVAFESEASNLVAGNTNGRVDIFIKNLATGAITRISTNADGTEASGNSNAPVFSPDGTKVAFEISNRILNGNTFSQDIYVKDLEAGTLTPISTDAAGTQGNSLSSSPVFSPNGTKVAFSSSAFNLVAGDTNGVSDIFIKDLATGAITRVSTNAASAQGNGYSGSPVFSPDGTKVAFFSYASNLVTGDTNLAADIFVKDLSTGSVTQISTAADGTQGNSSSYSPVFSPDGTKVAFFSYASKLVPGDAWGRPDVFLKDLTNGAIIRVSTNDAGIKGNNFSYSPAVSPDGTKVAFESDASNLVVGDRNRVRDIFVKDLATGAITRVSVSDGGTQGNGHSGAPVFSADGTKLAFFSYASNLVAGDTNGVWDIFVVDLAVTTSVLPAPGPGHTIQVLGAAALNNESFAGIHGAVALYLNGIGDQSVTLGATAQAAFRGLHPVIQDSANATSFTVDATGLSAAAKLDLYAIGGTAYFHGGAEADTFHFINATWQAAGHVVDGGAGRNVINLTLTSSSTDADFAGISHINELDLMAGSNGSLALGANARAAFGTAPVKIVTKPDAVLHLDGQALPTGAGGAGYYAAGAAGNDSLIGSAGNDSLYGKGGDNFYELGQGGKDVIYDFVHGHDHIQIDSGTIHNFAGLASRIGHSGASALISLGTGSTIKLVNIDYHTLSASDFIFH